MLQNIPEELAQKAADGDMEAFEKIYKASSAFVYTIAMRITRHEADAADVTQEVFIKLHRELKNFRRAASFKSWLYRIATNTAINAYNKRAREKGRRESLEETLPVFDSGSETCRAIERREREERLAALLDKLSPEERACILLREVEGLSYQEIAAARQTNINTVRTRLRRAREALLKNAAKEVVSCEV